MSTKGTHINNSFSNNLILFRKNSRTKIDEKCSNSMIIIDNDKMSFNVVDKEFFNKKRIRENISHIRKDAHKICQIDTKENKKPENKNNKNGNNNIISEDFKIAKNIGDEIEELKNIKLKKSTDDGFIILTSKRSEDNKLNDVNNNKDVSNEIILLQSNIIKDNNISNINQKITKAVNIHEENFENTIDFPFKMCLICDIYFNFDNIIDLKCLHIFCIKCAKLFYEEKIEEGKKELICPIFKCPEAISNDLIKKIVTEKHYCKLLKKIEILSEKDIFKNNDENVKFNVNIKSINTIVDHHDFKMYSKKHVFEITNNVSFLYFSKTKDIYCNNCHEESLFGKSCRNFIKCMNCLHSYCKYCGKKYNIGHFDFTGNTYCKIFLRKNCKYLPTVRNRCKEFLLDFIIFLLGYLVFILGILNYINVALSDLMKIRDNHFCGIFIHIIIMILITLIVLPILFMTLPFYPYIVVIFK